MSNSEFSHASHSSSFSVNGSSRRWDAGVHTTYKHILVPFDPESADHAALSLATLLSKSHQANLTFLHVLPEQVHHLSASKPRSAMRGLNAIERLHYSLPLSGTSNMLRQQSHSLDVAQANLKAFVDQQLPDSSLDVRTECRTGAPAEAILTFCEEEHVDLIILSSQLSWWGVPVVPRDVRRVLKSAKQQVIVVRPQAVPQMK